MRSCINSLAVALCIGSPAIAGTQIVASPGITLTEAAQEKFNHDTWSGEPYVKPVPGSATPSTHLYSAAGVSPEEGQSLTLEQLHVAKINRESSGDDQQLAPASVSRGYGQRPPDYSRLAFSIGLSPEEAAELSGPEIANKKLNFEH